MNGVKVIYFEDGKTYSVAEFDTLMETADSENGGRSKGCNRALPVKQWYEADADDEFLTASCGHDKVKFYYQYA